MTSSPELFTGTGGPGGADSGQQPEGQRQNCYRCRRPLQNCLCPTEAPLPTRSRIVLLMHPHEFKKRKCNTGLLTCLNLQNSEYIYSLDMDGHPRVRELLADPHNFCLLLYPGPQAVNISADDFSAGSLEDFQAGAQRLVIFLIDATWSLAYKLLRDNPGLLRMPQFKLTPLQASRYVIKRQPKDFCLSTLETVHEILLALEKAGLDSYDDKDRLIDTFKRMQDYQLQQAEVRHNPRHHIRKHRKAGEESESPASDR
ncbi:MAG: DTW domain-containing protein [Spirochaetes bacterium]|nr:DTW domain-containing protein [Spirochaetota bacterium]MBU0955865.1 DTW domain-containing protein [Spirochaetota bacterium]